MESKTKINIGTLRNIGKEKGQGEIHPAHVLSSSLMDKRSSAERPFKIYHIKKCLSIANRMKVLCLLSCDSSVRPEWDLNPQPILRQRIVLSRLSYRGDFSYNNKTNIFDNISSMDINVKQFINLYVHHA